MCEASANLLEIKIGENRDTSLIDLLEDESQLPEMLLERQCIKEDIRELIEELPEMQGRYSIEYGIGDVCRANVYDSYWSDPEYEP